MYEFKNIQFPKGATLKECANHFIYLSKIIKSATFKLEDLQKMMVKPVNCKQ